MISSYPNFEIISRLIIPKFEMCFTLIPASIYLVEFNKGAEKSALNTLSYIL